MKNYLLKFMLVIAACMSFVACQEDDIETKVDCTLEASVAFDKADKEGRKVTLIAPVVEDATYQWFINDEEITAGKDKSQFLHVFEGEETKFDVCVSITKNGCEEANRVCEVYEIAKIEEDGSVLECDLVAGIKMDSNVKQEGREIKVVGAIYGNEGEEGFTGIKVNYKWYVNKELIKSEVGLNEFIHVFEKDELMNTICLVTSTVGCDEEFRACLDYNLPTAQDCDFPLDFTIEKTGDQEVKLSVVEKRDDFVYQWSRSGFDFVGAQESEFIYFDAQDGDEYCLFVKTPDCPEGKKVCKTYEKSEAKE